MSDVLRETFDNPFAAELQSLRANWGWFVVLGVALVILGTLAILAPFIASLWVTMMVGILLLVGAGVEFASAIWGSRFRGFFLHLLAGVIYLALGLVVIDHPGVALAGLTLVLAAAFMARGVLNIIFSLSHRFHGWFWLLLDGLILLALGIMIWRRLPGDAYWVLGVFVGIEMLFNGWSWVMLGIAVRQLPAAPAAPASPTTPASA